VTKGRATKPSLELGICGEHGGDPASIAKCDQLGLDYVSCSPFRVPVARLAAAQAALGRRTSAAQPQPARRVGDLARVAAKGLPRGRAARARNGKEAPERPSA